MPKKGHLHSCSHEKRPHGSISLSLSLLFLSLPMVHIQSQSHVCTVHGAIHVHLAVGPTWGFSCGVGWGVVVVKDLVGAYPSRKRRVQLIILTL